MPRFIPSPQPARRYRYIKGRRGSSTQTRGKRTRNSSENGECLFVYSSGSNCRPFRHQHRHHLEAASDPGSFPVRQVWLPHVRRWASFICAFNCHPKPVMPHLLSGDVSLIPPFFDVRWACHFVLDRTGLRHSLSPQQFRAQAQHGVDRRNLPCACLCCVPACCTAEPLSMTQNS